MQGFIQHQIDNRQRDSMMGQWEGKNIRDPSHLKERGGDGFIQHQVSGNKRDSMFGQWEGKFMAETQTGGARPEDQKTIAIDSPMGKAQTHIDKIEA